MRLCKAETAILSARLRKPEQLPQEPLPATATKPSARGKYFSFDSYMRLTDKGYSTY